MARRIATREDFRTGTTLFDSEGHEILIQDKYDTGIWNARVFGRLSNGGIYRVGDKVVFEGEARFYRVEVEDEDA